MNGLILYIVVSLLTFFVASCVVARYSPRYYPTDAAAFWILVVYALAWPLTITLTVATLLLMGIAMLAEKLAGGAE